MATGTPVPSESALYGYASPGHVAIVSAEEQRAVNIAVDSIEELPATERHVLRTTGTAEWFAPEPVREELRRLQGTSSDPNRSIDEALELVEYACANGTGVAIVPPLA